MFVGQNSLLTSIAGVYGEGVGFEFFKNLGMGWGDGKVDHIRQNGGNWPSCYVYTCSCWAPGRGVNRMRLCDSGRRMGLLEKLGHKCHGGNI